MKVEKQGRSEDKSRVESIPVKVIVGYIFQVILFGLIILYAILSQSLFSTISIIFMLVATILTIATPYHFNTQQTLVRQPEQQEVLPFPIYKIIWSVYIVVSLLSLIFKVVIYFTDFSSDWSINLQQFFQVQSLLYVFLPMILIPFAGVCILIEPRKLNLLYFKKKINKFLPLPLYLGLGILILLIQIFSVSIAGLIYFSLIIYLFSMKSFNFNDGYFKCMLIFIQIFTTIMIIISYLVTANLLQTSSFQDDYEFLGINSINNFLNSPVDRGHIICEILLSLMCAYLNRLFIYQSFNSMYDAEVKPEIEESELFGKKNFKREVIQKESEERSESFRKIRYSGKDLQPINRASQKVIHFQQQVQLKDFSERDSFHSDNHELAQHAKEVQQYQHQQKDQMFFEQVLDFEDQKVDEEGQKKFKRIKTKTAANYLKRVRRKVFKLIHTIFSFLNSPQFSLRVIEILSIIVIQRYNNVYSFVALLWLAIVASVQNLKFVFILTLIMLPLEIGNYIITYFYNIPFSPAQAISKGEIYGFQKAEELWVDVIIFNIYLNYIILFLRSYSKLKNVNHGMSKQFKKKRPVTWELFVAFIFRYTYLLTLIAMFFLGFTNPTIMNIIYVGLFLVFFSSGDSLIIVKKLKKGRERLALTTFSKRFWYVIVYYTLLCIIGKYIYFLFFPNDLSEWLQPVGINEVYYWNFNFSLSSICKSNTTPQFIIFILAEIQIMIYRSYIYTNYSFSIMANVNENLPSKPVSFRERMKAKFINFIVLMNELYHQSIYYVSGIIIIGCSYRWSLFGLTIIILTSFGLLTTFRKKLLGIILFLNLAFLFLNYAIILIIQYPIITDAIGSEGIEQITKLSLFIGFSLQTNSYASLFILNVVIFYFCVICYALSNILQARIAQNIRVTHVNEENGRMSMRQSLKESIKDSHRSIHQQSVIDSEFEDQEFAENYRRGVILETQKYYYENLIKKYQWMRNFGKFWMILLTDFVAIYVIIQCLYFRLSITMFLFLIIYMIFYFSLFDRIGMLYVSSGYYSRIEQLLDNFTNKQNLLQNRTVYENFVGDKDELKKEDQFISIMAENVQLLKNEWKKKIWKYSAILSATCLILTYASQFMISDFYHRYIDYEHTQIIETILFVVGINVNEGQSFETFSYFYFIMLIINILEKLMLKFISSLREHESGVDQNAPKKSMRELTSLENPDYLINQYVSEDFILETERLHPITIEQELIHLEIEPNHQESLYYEQANLLIYFEFKFVQIRMSFIYGCLNFIIRFYVWLMLINVYAKNDAFAVAYLIAILAFWFKKLQFNLIKDINKAAILILCLQYFVLLLDINSVTSPLPLPSQSNISLLQYLIKDPAWVEFLAVSSQNGPNSNFLTSFLINSVIIFLTEICFTIFQLISNFMIRLIMQVYLKYEDMLQKLHLISAADPIIINFDGYKHFSHRIITFFYENIIMNSYLIVSLLMFMLLAGIHSYLAIFLLIISFSYIYLGIFTRLSEKDAIFKYTRVFFRVFNILQFIIIILSIVLNMPFIPSSDENSSINIVNEFGALTSLEQIFLMLFIQLWLDLNASKSFQEVSSGYRQQMKKRQNIYLRCLTYQRNNFLVSSLIREYKQVFSFDTSIADAMRIIKEWHSTMNKQMKTIDYEFEQIKQNKNIERIKQQIQAEHISDDHRQFSLLLENYVRERTYVTLTHKYYDTLKYIIQNINGIIFHDDIKLSAWNFILQDYDIIEKMLENNDQIMRQLTHSLIDGDEDQSMAQSLENLHSDLRQGEQTQKLKIELETPTKLKIDPQISSKRSTMSQVVLPFILSNIQPFIIVLVEIYYVLNPCILSFPLLAFFFCYYLLANRKYMNLVVLYIFILILAGELLQMESISNLVNSLSIIKFFFYVDTDTNQIYFCLEYLYFLFFVIFISQEIIRYNGNRYKNQSDVQNLEQAFLRILMNQSEESSLNLWKYSHSQEQFLENVNPFNISVFQIENNLEKLMESRSSFGDIFSNRKIGIDLYPIIASIQIFITIFLIFFYPLMTDIKGFNLEESTKYYQFSSEMVVSVLVHVANIVIQRKITLLIMPRGRKLLIKYCYTVLIFALFSWFIFYLAPYKPSLTLTASFYSPSPALVVFSFFYFFYFYISALQIKYGYKQFKSFNSLMTRRGYSNYYAVSAYTAIPFLYEIKIIMDWTFSDTSLTMFDWFKQFSIYLRAFKSKIQYYNATTSTVLGSIVPWYSKIIGWAGFIIILLIIFGPMILFSGLNPIADPNLVISGSMTVALQVKGGNSFVLYQTSHFSSPPVNYTEAMFDNQGFDQVPTLQQMTASDIPLQFQSITYEPYSDNNWGISVPNYLSIVRLLNQTIEQYLNTNQSNNQFQLTVTYQLNREIAKTVAEQTLFYYPSSDGYLNLELLISLYETLTNCNSMTYLPNFYISLIRLNTIGTTYKPRPIAFKNSSGQPFLTNVTLNLECLPNVTEVTDTNNVYWGLFDANQNEGGLMLYVYCDKYQNIIGGYGFTALYTSIILVVAGFIRSLFDGNLPFIPYEMNPKPDNILQICEAINILRVRKQYRQEYLMYYQLIDIIRSPEIMKYMSGSYPYLIEKAYLQSQEKEEEKEMLKRKTL